MPVLERTNTKQLLLSCHDAAGWLVVKARFNDWLTASCNSSQKQFIRIWCLRMCVATSWPDRTGIGVRVGSDRIGDRAYYSPEWGGGQSNHLFATTDLRKEGRKREWPDRTRPDRTEPDLTVPKNEFFLTLLFTCHVMWYLQNRLVPCLHACLLAIGAREKYSNYLSNRGCNAPIRRSKTWGNRANFWRQINKPSRNYWWLD